MNRIIALQSPCIGKYKGGRRTERTSVGKYILTCENAVFNAKITNNVRRAVCGIMRKN